MTQLFAGTIVKRTLRRLALALLCLPALAFAAADLLLDEAAVAAQLGKTPDYQLLDARPVAAQQAVPLAFSTKYQPLMAVKKGLVFVVADTDADALKIAGSIPADGRSVFAVKGGATAWKQAVAKTPVTSAMPDNFTIPKNTCEAGKAVQELKSDQALQREKKK